MPDLSDFLPHFPPKMSQSFVDYATEVAFKWSRYIFTQRYGKQQWGYCTHCKKEFMTDNLKHNVITNCPECGSECFAKASGRGRKNMIDEVYFVYYEKSIINPQAIVARGIYAVRDYRFDYRKTETLLTVGAMYVFEMGNSRMIKRRTYYSDHQSLCRVGKWENCKLVFSLFNSGSIANIRSCYSRESIEEAVKDTPFTWSGWESYNLNCMTGFFDLYAKYPCVEYLTKLGFTNLVTGKLEGSRTYSVINWRGNNIFKVLKLTKLELNEIKKQKLSIDYWTLWVLKWSKKEGSNFSPIEAAEFTEEYAGYYFEELIKLSSYGNARRITGYLRKQRDKYRKYLSSQTSALTTWRDYIADCIKLNMDLTEDSVLYPRNLYTAHQNTIRQIKIKADKTLNKKIGSRLKSLEKYRFEYAGLFIRPAESSLELLDEGKALNHCVGNYTNRYAMGETNLFFIRTVAEPDKPFYTVEICRNEIIQVRGLKNCQPTDEVDWFLDAFKKEKLKPKKAKKPA